MEEWKELNDLSTDKYKYYISNKGRLKRITLSNNKIKYNKLTTTNLGYKIVHIQNNHYLVHRLVAKYFVPISDKYSSYSYEELDVNHIDEDKTNNYADNLEWCTHKDNCNHGNRNTKALETKKNNENIKAKNREIENYTYLLLGLMIGNNRQSARL